MSLQHLQAAALDSAFLKTEHKGQLITLCIRDDDNLLLLVAVAIFDKESEESYTYFLQNCMKSADSAATFNSKDMTIFTDGHKGSPPALAKCLSNVEVYRCLQHYIRNAPAIGSVSAECRRVRESFGTCVDVFPCGRCWKRTYFVHLSNRACRRFASRTCHASGGTVFTSRSRVPDGSPGLHEGKFLP